VTHRCESRNVDGKDISNTKYKQSNKRNDGGCQRVSQLSSIFMATLSHWILSPDWIKDTTLRMLAVAIFI